MAKAEIFQQLEAEFQDLLAAINGLGDDAMTKVWYDQWCVRDILAHISGWHREMSEAFNRMARGERPVPEGVDYSDPNPWNARFAAAHRNTSPKAMVDELKASKDAFVAAAQPLADDRFEEGRAGYRILHATAIDHYREHAPPIRDWRQKEAI